MRSINLLVSLRNLQPKYQEHNLGNILISAFDALGFEVEVHLNNAGYPYDLYKVTFINDSDVALAQISDIIKETTATINHTIRYYELTERGMNKLIEIITTPSPNRISVNES